MTSKVVEQNPWHRLWQPSSNTNGTRGWIFRGGIPKIGREIDIFGWESRFGIFPGVEQEMTPFPVPCTCLLARFRYVLYCTYSHHMTPAPAGPANIFMVRLGDPFEKNMAQNSVFSDFRFSRHVAWKTCSPELCQCCLKKTNLNFSPRLGT